MGKPEAHCIPVAEAALGFAARQRHGEVRPASLRVATRNFDLRGIHAEVGGPNSGMTSTYAYDDATNRTGREIENPFAQLWMATSLSHVTGAADGNTWVGRPGMSAGYLTYGTNVTTIPAGSRTAVYRIMVDQVDSATSTIVAVDVYDATAGQFLLQLNVSPDYLATANPSAKLFVWYDLELPFTYDVSRLGHTIEIRTWYGGFGTVWVEKVGYR